MWAVPKPSWSLERCWVGNAKAKLGPGGIWVHDAEGLESPGPAMPKPSWSLLAPAVLGGLVEPFTSAQPGWCGLSGRRDAPQHPGAGLL